MRGRSISVAHVVPALFGEAGIFGGAERYAYELARCMSEVSETTLVAFGHHNAKRTVHRLRVVMLKNLAGPSNNPFNPALLGGLRKADVIHVHQTHTISASIAVMLGRLTGKPIFTTDLGGGGRCLQNYFDVRNWYSGHLHISRYSQHVHGHGDRANAHVIYGGVDCDKFYLSAAERSFPPSEKAVVFAGRLLPHKGIDDLILAIPEGMRLKIIGRRFGSDGGYYEHLRQLSVGRSVEFCESCSDEQLITEYQRALCVVLPSVYRSSFNGSTTNVPELLGQTPLEAMACGVPAIVTNVASLPEIVEDGVTGFVVPPNDSNVLREKLQWFRDHPQEADAMGATALAHVRRRFTWAATVERCIGHYQRSLP